MRRPAHLAAVVLLSLAATSCDGSSPAGPSQAPRRAGGDWTRFGYDASRRNAGPAATGIGAASLARLRVQRVRLDGTVDSSPVYLRRVRIGGGAHDAFFVTTSYGRTAAVDADTGSILWRFTPAGYGGWAGTYRITNATPVVGPKRRFLYTADPGGRIHKLRIGNGREVRSRRWPVAITRNPRREKIGPALNLAGGRVLAATGGYIGDAPPYQGHVAVIDARSGALRVWNALCSDRRGLLRPSACRESGAAIWARAGVVVQPRTGRLLVATGDGRWDGRTYWGDSVLLLAPDASRLLGNWTPRNQASLDSGDVDLGSTAPAVLASGQAVQGGKDARLRLLMVSRLNGTRRAGKRTGGELQTLGTPGGEGLFSAPAVWPSRGRTWLFAADGSATAAYRLSRGRLRRVWRVGTGGTSPVVAGGLLYVYDPGGGSLNVYVPTSGRRLARLDASPGHWNSPIVTDGRIALPVGNANDHRTSGELLIYR